MKFNFKGISLVDLCSWFGVTRQAYYQRNVRSLEIAVSDEVVLQMIQEIRGLHPRLGGRKLFVKLKEPFDQQGIKMGRDAFFDLLRNNNILIKRRKRYHVTTNSKHWMKKYPNLIRGVDPLGPNHIWVSDITYWKIKEKHYYISWWIQVINATLCPLEAVN